jgi:23S rRNA pseudouridine1911/1915/1917 synthase
MSPDQFKESILFEDKFLLIVNKPAGMAVEKISPQITTLEDLVYSYLLITTKKPFVGIVHRLDRPTSGIILLAKKPSVLKVMNSQFEKKTIKKIYLALVTGNFIPTEEKLSHYLKKDTLQKKGIIFKERVPGSQEVKLKFRRLQWNENFSLLQIELITGKYHQIRAQLSAIGNPIAGDLLYGASPNTWRHDGIGLHASEIHFDHPETNERMILKSTWEYNPFAG